MPSSEPETIVPPEAEPNPEPLPEWKTAFHEWGSWWEIHNYGFGCVFAILAAFCVFSLVRLRVSQKLSLARYFTAVTGLLLVFTSTRALYLLLDPYEAHKDLSLPVVFIRVLFAIGYPCLTSVFSLINFAFVKVNSLWVILKRLQNVKFLSTVIIAHFLLVLTVYLLVTFAPQLARLFILCQSILIVWWLLLVVCFVYSALLVIWNEKLKNKYINRDSKNFEDSGNGMKKQRHLESQNKENVDDNTTSKGTKRIVRISGVVAIAGLISVILEFYSLFGIYKLYALKERFVKPWPWWSYQTGSRAVEVCLCCIVAYVVYPTIRGRRTGNDTAYSKTTSAAVSNRKTTRERTNEACV